MKVLVVVQNEQYILSFVQLTDKNPLFLGIAAPFFCNPSVTETPERTRLHRHSLRPAQRSRKGMKYYPGREGKARKDMSHWGESEMMK